MSWSAPAPAQAARSCKRPPRPEPRPGDLRPTDVIGAFFVAGILFLIAAAVTGVADAIEPSQHGRWLALHFAFVGGISQLVIGASQFFAGAFLATDPPGRPLIRAQLATWNAGTVALAVAVSVSSDPLLLVAVGALAAGLAIYAVSLARMARASLRSAVWAVRWYATGAVLFGVGIVAGAALAWPVVWAHGDLLGAHMALNLAGWFGLAIVGTLHTFYPSLTRTTLRFPRLEPWAFATWVGGVVALAVGYGWSLEALAIVGWLSLAAGACCLLANVAGCLLAAPRPLTLPARIIGVAQPFLLAALALAAATSLVDGPVHALVGETRSSVGTLIVAGWIGLTVLGSLMHLLAVVLRVRNFARSLPAARPRRDATVATLSAIGVAVLALSQLLEADAVRSVAIPVLFASYAFLVATVLVLAGRVVREARPGI